MINRLPLAHRKANKARCDKRRNKARKETKMLNKQQMGCCYKQCNNFKTYWRIQFDCKHKFPKSLLKTSSSKTWKNLLNLSDKNFELYFKKLGECVCRKHLWEESLLDLIEERKAA